MTDQIINTEALEAAEPWMLQNALKQMVTQLETAVQADLFTGIVAASFLNHHREPHDQFYREVTRELVNVARSHSSNWSGGNSAKNLYEQVVHRVALDMASHIYMVSEQSLNGAANDLEAKREAKKS